MGTKMAPACANLFMGKLEEKLNLANHILWYGNDSWMTVLSFGPDPHPNSLHV